jgi:hypothetical protein
LTRLAPGFILWGSSREVPLKKYSITIQEHQEYGLLGLVVDTGRDYFEPAIDGLVLAHDILEHPIKPHSCGYTDELMAIGGFLAGRVEMEYKTRGYNPASIRDIESDIHSLLLSALNEDGVNNTITEIDKCHSYIKCPQTMEELKGAVKKGILDVLDEWLDGEYEDHLLKVYNLNSIEEFHDLMTDSYVGWICKGYNLFKKRFNNINTYNLFDDIRKVSDNFLSNQIEGMTGTLCVQFSTGDVYIEEEYD